MATRDLCNNIHPVRAVAPGAAVTDNTPFVSAIIDTKGYESLTFLIAAGSLADADVTVTALVEASDAANMAGAVTVPDKELIGTEAQASLTFADDNATRKIGYVGGPRYVRLTLTPANNTGNIFLSAIALLGHPHQAPTPNLPV